MYIFGAGLGGKLVTLIFLVARLEMFKVVFKEFVIKTNCKYLFIFSGTLDELKLKRRDESNSEGMPSA